MCYVSGILVLPVMASIFVFFLMIRRPPRSTLDRSSAASDVYKRQGEHDGSPHDVLLCVQTGTTVQATDRMRMSDGSYSVSYTHLRAHETVLDLVCRLLLEKKNKHISQYLTQLNIHTTYT